MCCCINSINQCFIGWDRFLDETPVLSMVNNFADLLFKLFCDALEYCSVLDEKEDYGDFYAYMQDEKSYAQCIQAAFPWMDYVRGVFPQVGSYARVGQTDIDDPGVWSTDLTEEFDD